MKRDNLISCNCVSFDLDGTLIDSAPAILRTLKHTLSTHGLKPVVPIERNLIGPPLNEVLRVLTASTDPVLLQQLFQTYIEVYDDSGYKQLSVYDGVAKVLIELKRADCSLFIVTNKRILPTRKILESLDWVQYFDEVYSPDMHKHEIKEKSKLLRLMISENNIDRRRCVYIGDRVEDLTAAADAEVSFLAAGWGYYDWSTIPDTLYSSAKVLPNPCEIVPNIRIGV